MLVLSRRVLMFLYGSTGAAGAAGALGKNLSFTSDPVNINTLKPIMTYMTISPGATLGGGAGLPGLGAGLSFFWLLSTASIMIDASRSTAEPTLVLLYEPSVLKSPAVVVRAAVARPFKDRLLSAFFTEFIFVAFLRAGGADFPMALITGLTVSNVAPSAFSASVTVGYLLANAPLIASCFL